MERTNFEKLQIYQLSEKLADSVWNIVIGWDSFARDTVGKQIVRSVDSIGANIAEEAAEVVSRIIGGLLGLRADPFMKLFIGCGGPTVEVSYRKPR